MVKLPIRQDVVIPARFSPVNYWPAQRNLWRVERSAARATLLLTFSLGAQEPLGEEC